MKRFLQTGRGLALLAVVGSALVGFSALFVRLHKLFQDPLEDMSFGWLVPIFSIYVLWTKRRELRESMDAGAPCWGGWLASIPCALLALLGARGYQIRLEQAGFIGLCVTLPWAFFGRRMARHFLFPALYLAFTIPVATYLDTVTIHLRLLASGTAMGVLRGFGMEVVQQGTTVFVGADRFGVDVASPCSGLRSLFALMALTAAYAWYTQPTWKRRTLLFACSVPLAVLGNIMRVVSICLVASWTPEFATGFYHDYSGYVVFVVAIALMVACGEGITRFCEKFAERPAEDGHSDEGAGETSDDDAEKAPAADHSDNGKFSALFPVPFLVALCLIPIFLLQALSPEAALAEAPKVILPPSLPGLHADDMRFCQNEQCGAAFSLSDLKSKHHKSGGCLGCGKDESGLVLLDDVKQALDDLRRRLRDSKASLGSSAKLPEDGHDECPVCNSGRDKEEGWLIPVAGGELNVLPPDTQMQKKAYYSEQGDVFEVTLVLGGRSKSSIHRSELCMPAQGFLMQSPCDFTVGDSKRPFHAVQLRHPKMPPMTLAYTFLNQEGVRTSSHMWRILVDTWDRSVHNRIDRWVMVTVRAHNHNTGHGFSLDYPSDRERFLKLLSKLTEDMP